MKTRFSLFLVAALICLLVGTAFTQNPNGAEKAAAASGGVSSAFNASTVPIVTPFATVLTTDIKPPGGKDLLITYSAQTILGTTSVNNDFPFSPFTFTAENARINVRCLVDNVPVPIAPPSTATVVGLDNLVRSTSHFTPFPPNFDFLTLVLQEGGARSFTWIAPDVGVGNHTVKIQRQFVLANFKVPSFGTFSSVFAVIGPSTLTVEEVMLDAR